MIKKLSEEDKLYIANKINENLRKTHPRFGRAIMRGSYRKYFIEGFFKDIPDYVYLSASISDKTLDEMKDLDSIVDYFIEGWNEVDTERDHESFKGFITQGEKYGWD